MTTIQPEKRLAQHNRNHDEYAGKLVKETGQEWVLKTFIAVVDHYWAEKAFWRATPFPDIPFRDGVEIAPMEWDLVQKGIAAAEKAGVWPPLPPRVKEVRNNDWMRKQLESTGIRMTGRYGGLVKGTQFECLNGHAFTESAGVIANRKSCPLCCPRPDYRKSGPVFPDD